MFRRATGAVRRLYPNPAALAPIVNPDAPDLAFIGLGVYDSINGGAVYFGPPLPDPDCRVYWGSHGCQLERGHDGPHLCHCARDDWQDHLPDGYEDDEGVCNVGAPPYYGTDTAFYGEDA